MRHARVKLRSCRIDDLEAVLGLWKVAETAGSLPDTIEALRRRLERDRDLFVVAESAGRLVGTLIGGWDGWRGNLYRLAVHPEYRRRGIARALVRTVEKRLRDHGARRITALVLTDADVAQAFWHRAGYDRDRSIARHVRNV
jgi:ribosomal protein S18 acetylase RimI-like enzyme